MGFEPTPFRNSALSYRLRPLGHIVIDRTSMQNYFSLGIYIHSHGHLGRGSVSESRWQTSPREAIPAYVYSANSGLHSHINVVLCLTAKGEQS